MNSRCLAANLIGVSVPSLLRIFHSVSNISMYPMTMSRLTLLRIPMCCQRTFCRHSSLRQIFALRLRPSCTVYHHQTTNRSRRSRQSYGYLSVEATIALSCPTSCRRTTSSYVKDAC
jgi:hypothetical protein